MSHSDPVNWQPISEMPLIAGMIDESIKDTRAFIKTLTEARYSKRPHVMDDATADCIDRVILSNWNSCTSTRSRSAWRTERPSADQACELDRMEERNRHLRDAITTVLALSRELRKGTIERVLEKSDIELGLKALLGSRPATPANPAHNIAYNTATVQFYTVEPSSPCCRAGESQISTRSPRRYPVVGEVGLAEEFHDVQAHAEVGSID
jgi:hypothetical protein